MKKYELTSVQPYELSVKTSLIQKSFAAFARLWQAFVRSVETTQEPQVTQMHNRQGHSYFKIYDPLTGQHHYVDSEQAARIWLEHRSRH